jgi:anti-anti-sigma regulatory factor
MDIKRGFDPGGPVWVIRGDIDDDSAFHLESMLLNSQWKGGIVTLDLTGVDRVSIEGKRTFHRIYEGLKSRGGDVKVIDTHHAVEGI